MSRISDVTVREAIAGGQGTAIEFTDHARAVVLNGLGRYREALRPAQDAADATPELAVAGWGAFELVEAAAKRGETELARRGIERIEERNSVIETDWGYGILARSRALLAAGEEANEQAESLFREAIDRLGRTPLRPDTRPRAPAVRRVAAPRGPPRRRARAAPHGPRHAGRDRHGRVRRARSAGAGRRRRDGARKRSVETITTLTAQEAYIAQLARDGLTNPEIGTRLFLSARTVEWHLRKIFTKLGISSRRELRAALAQSGEDRKPCAASG